jgi:hypothetical protein
MKNVRVSIALVAVLFCKLLLLCPHPVMAQTTVVVRNDFEDGTLQGWTPRGNSVVLTNTTEAVVPQDDTGIHSNFESGTTEGWGPRGGVNLTVTTADQHSGAYSLLTTNRTANWQGPSINAAGKMYKGSQYTVIVWVKMAPGQPDTQIRLSIQRTLAGTTNFSTIVSNTTVTVNQWVRLKKTFDFIWDYDSLSLYLESNDNPTASFYIDDFDLTFVPPPVIQSDIPSVYQTLSEHFPVGAAISSGDLTGVIRQNSIRVENGSILSLHSVKTPELNQASL